MSGDADFIIVGGGSAGCVLANRLSASGRYRVALIEAGGSDRHPWTRIPIAYGKCFYHPQLNWKFVSAPVPGLGGRQVYCPRGRVLGGSSSINAMVFIRGAQADFDRWKALGNPGWGFADVLPYFRRMEDNQAGENEWRARGGPLHVTSTAGQVHPLCARFMAAAQAIGIPVNEDFNGESQEGVGLYQITTRDGLRASSAAAFLRPAMRCANLEVITHSQVTRIIVERGRAAGVEYRLGDAVRTIRTRGEVILAAGAVGSPQILQLSGIGDPALLGSLGIETVHAAPAVGANLQDHLCIDHLYRLMVPSLNQILGPLWRRPLLGLEYLATRRGPLSLSVNQAGGFVRARPEAPEPNIQLYFSPLSYTRAIPGKRALMRPDPFPGLLLSASNTHPHSRGHVRIRSADPFEAPEIQPNYLDDQRDLDDLIEGAKLLRRLASQAPLADIIAEELEPGSGCQTDEDMAADIRARASSVFHLSGTCAMGPDASSAVVDARLRVHGIGGLRVVDASIFPTLISGNTNAAAMMIGEKGADLILEDARM